MAKAIKRILTELTQFNSSLSDPSSSSSRYIESLVPKSPDNLLHLSAILSGQSLPPETGYANGRWLLSIDIPENYPNTPPKIQFITKICHPNIKWESGEVCLDVLQDRWTPVLGIVGALECIGRLLVEGATDSPLGIEVAALERIGDTIGKRSLVGFWCDEERWNGELDN
ncbi:putative ubiquitin-conjugating enzyme e2 [Erysiphe necator]|uniref:Putative ubiquitin-conjugating enzyme e2 n=1 Tax=Uncinula necator TaxID=52586 RepID=A0A0B1PEP5_UNCNE|nr:putative ubiquitin-conjugating enzyme e2 [Erysiphe necator]